MPSAKFYVTDHDGEESSFTIPTAAPAAGTVDTMRSDIQAYVLAPTAISSVILGYITHWVFNILNVMFHPARQRAADSDARIETQAIVVYHDATSMREFTLTIPAPNPSDQNGAYPGKYFVDGDANNASVWNTFVQSFELFGLTPDGDSPVVDEVYDAGANL